MPYLKINGVTLEKEVTEEEAKKFIRSNAFDCEILQNRPSEKVLHTERYFALCGWQFGPTPAESILLAEKTRKNHKMASDSPLMEFRVLSLSRRDSNQ